MAKGKEPPCHPTGSVIATTIKSPSSSNLELPSFMPGCVLPPPTWMKASSPKATSLTASQLRVSFNDLGQVDDLMSVDTEGHLLVTRQLDDEFQLLARRMPQSDNHYNLNLSKYCAIDNTETKAQPVERSR